MPLVKDTLESGLVAAFSVGAVPPPATPTREAVALLYAIAFTSYLTPAAGCSAVPTSNVAPRIKALQDSFIVEFEKNPDSPLDAAKAWAAVIDPFVADTLFGGTGKVASTLGALALQAPLGVVLFAAQAAGLSFADVAKQMASVIDVWTKGTLTVDTALPPPSGCAGPIV